MVRLSILIELLTLATRSNAQRAWLMAASAVGPPSEVAAILSASLGIPQYEVTRSAKLANISRSIPPPVASRASSRSTRNVPPTEESSRPRLFAADPAYTERDPSLLQQQSGFQRHLSDPALVMQGDLIPYHMPDSVVSGVNDNIAIVIDLINRAGGYVAIYTALEHIGSAMYYAIDISIDELNKRCVLFYCFDAVPLPLLFYFFRLTDRPLPPPPPLPSPTSARPDFSKESLVHAPTMIDRLFAASGT